MNNKIASLLTAAVMTGLFAASTVSAHDTGHDHDHEAKDKAHHNGCKGKDGCKANHKKAGKAGKAAKNKKVTPPATDAKTPAAPTEEAPH